MIGKNLLLVTFDGLMVEIEPRRGKVARALDLGRRATSQPVVADGYAYVLLEGDLHAVPWGDKKDGAVWPQWGGGPGRNGIR